MPQELTTLTSVFTKAKNKKTLLMVAGIFVSLIFTTVASFILVSKSQKTNPNTSTTTTTLDESKGEKKLYQEEQHTKSNQSKLNPYLNTPCDSNPKVQFTHDFTEVVQIKSVEPTIITPGNSRHRAWLNINTAKGGKVPVYAPVDSELVGGVYKNARGAIDYDLHFQVSCEIWYLINHVTDPADQIRAAFPATPRTDTRDNGLLKQVVKVKAGEFIGYTTGTPTAHNFDFGVFDLNHINENLPADEGSVYGKEKNFICPFDVLPTELKAAYYSKIISAEKQFSNCK